MYILSHTRKQFAFRRLFDNQDNNYVSNKKYLIMIY